MFRKASMKSGFHIYLSLSWLVRCYQRLACSSWQSAFPFLFAGVEGCFG
jgi:hypothetical protein